MSEKDKIEQEKVGTKKKILQVAARLFAVNGPIQTSIRDIAQEADVNVAAVNYHFHTKERLLNEVLRQIHSQMTEEIINLFSSKNLDFPSLCEELFYFYYQSESELTKIFMLAMHERVADFEFIMGGLEKQHLFGPPGMQLLYDALDRELTEHKLPVKDEDREWAVKTMGMHIGTLANFMRLHPQNKVCPEEKILYSIRKMAKAIINEI